MGVGSLLEAGRTALNAQKLALEVTGENVTNVNTPGYSRQTAILETAPTSTERGFPLGNGVIVSTVQRTFDAFLQRQILGQNSTNGQGETANATLQRVQTLFNEFTSTGLGKSLQNFFNAWQDLASNPQGVPERQSVLATGQQLVDDFHRINASLGDLKADMNASLSGINSQVNQSLKQIAILNGNIMQVEMQSGGHANEMRDQRDLLIKELSRNIGVNFVEQADGVMNVTLSNGQPLVTGKNAASLSLQTNAGTGLFDVMLTPPGGGAAVLATGFIGGTGNNSGVMGATLQMRDTVIPRYLADLDELAATLATQVNGLHAAGFGMTGASTGLNFFTPPAATAGYSGSAGIALGISALADVAAADANTTVGGTGNNKMAQAIAGLYSKTVAMSSGTMTLEAFYNDLVGKVGVDVQNASHTESQSDALLKQLDTLRESASGVSLDEELANLVKYQKAYEGAAKLINVATEMMDTVLGLVR